MQVDPKHTSKGKDHHALKKGREGGKKPGFVAFGVGRGEEKKPGIVTNLERFLPPDEQEKEKKRQGGVIPPTGTRGEGGTEIAVRIASQHLSPRKKRIAVDSPRRFSGTGRTEHPTALAVAGEKKKKSISSEVALDRIPAGWPDSAPRRAGGKERNLQHVSQPRTIREVRERGPLGRVSQPEDGPQIVGRLGKEGKKKRIAYAGNWDTLSIYHCFLSSACGGETEEKRRDPNRPPRSVTKEKEKNGNFFSHNLVKRRKKKNTERGALLAPRKKGGERIRPIRNRTVTNTKGEKGATRTWGGGEEGGPSHSCSLRPSQRPSEVE